MKKDLKNNGKKKSLHTEKSSIEDKNIDNIHKKMTSISNLNNSKTERKVENFKNNGVTDKKIQLFDGRFLNNEINGVEDDFINGNKHVNLLEGIDKSIEIMVLCDEMLDCRVPGMFVSMARWVNPF
jgi:hypothetical protein